MTRNYAIIAASCTCLMASSQTASSQDEKPNIIFVLTDDQAPWAFGLSGDTNALTPVMDRLATQGAHLKNAFVPSPVCSPARVTFMTGRYASEYKIHDFIVMPTHSVLTFDPSFNAGLNPESITFAEVLQDAGYKTGLVGKWHLGDWTTTDDKKYHPTNHGYDYFMGLTGGGVSPVNPTLEAEGEIREFKGLTSEILADYAMDFIKRNADKNFMLSWNTRAPHTRWLPVTDEDWAPFEDMDPHLPNPYYPDLNVERAKTRMREYLASTHSVDRNLGRIMELLDKLNLREKTIIIFFSDHGYMMGHNGLEHKGNGKWITNTSPEPTEDCQRGYRPNLYDNSLKVPAFVYWPGVIKPGTVIHNTISSLDLFPTIVEMAGADMPDDHLVRGRSIIPLLKREEVGDWCDDFYSEYTMINYCLAFLRSYRTPEWKLVRDFLNSENDELYHIAYDPEENINLIHDQREEVRNVINDLHQKIIGQMRTINDPLLNEIEVDKEYYKKVNKAYYK